MTDSSLWSHLLCAVWIPEITISNMVYMEPVEGVELVPKSRWKLHCYICKQRMGACIQCSNKSCYLAFHVTCARKAKLFLSMRQQVPTDPSGGTAVGAERSLIFDGSQLKAFCDKHVPSEWRKEFRTDIAIRNVQHYYEDLFYEKEWGDSQMKALTPGYDSHPTIPKLTLTVGGKRKRPSAGTGGAKTVWRLPSGAPIIPQVLYNTIIEAISRFAIRKPKEYVAEICKYWTLKREARRDASLLKRLQVSVSSNFTSDEVTKKDYSAYHDGEEKLKRRLDFAIKLRHDLERIRLLADDIKKREKEKLRQAECLKEMIDAVYFPVIPILTPILDRAQQLDSKDFFKVEFGQIKQKLVDREYNTVNQFSRDILSLLTSSVTSRSKFAVMSIPEGGEHTLAESVPGTSTAAATPAAVIVANPMENLASTPTPTTPAVPKQPKALGDTAGKTAGRILRVIQPMLENAKLQELAMREDPNERLAGEVDERYQEILLERKKRDDELQAQLAAANAAAAGEITNANDVDKMDIDNPKANEQQEANDRAAEEALESATASLSQAHHKDDELPIGIPWYTKPFSPLGATLLSEERWMGMDVVRDMSPLSELDEDAIEMLQPIETPEVVSPFLEEFGSAVNFGNGDTHATKPRSATKAPINAGAWIPGTRVSLRTTKGTKKTSYVESQPPQSVQNIETPKPKQNGRAGSAREVDLQQVVVIGSTRSQTKQAMNKAQRRGRGYVWVEVEDEEETVAADYAADIPPLFVLKDPDAMDIDSEIPAAAEPIPAGVDKEAVDSVDDRAVSIDSPLTSVPDDDLDQEDRLSLDSLDLNALGGDDLVDNCRGDTASEVEEVDKHSGDEDNMETENTDSEFHTPLESGNAVASSDEGRPAISMAIDSQGATDQLSKELAAAVASQEAELPQPETESSPSKRSTRSPLKQKGSQSISDVSSALSPVEEAKSNGEERPDSRNGMTRSTPKKSPPVAGKGQDSISYTPLPMTTRSRRTLEPEATPTRRSTSRAAAGKKR
ncbi:nuA3 HAT complex component nto1 [Arthrobotrys musiformis]|uniref:NuA3 HAT complex component nto1 n=1 Tax=Arthrobotrys musiformis TaxID=47236 RepID=A0AAV9WLE5_9PEZI